MKPKGVLDRVYDHRVEKIYRVDQDSSIIKDLLYAPTRPIRYNDPITIYCKRYDDVMVIP